MESPVFPTANFHPFPLLPIELRLKIYSHVDALTPPRIIPFFLLPLGHPRTLTGRHLVGCLGTLHIYTGFIPTPALLHACQESRDFLLPKYRRNFEIKRRFEYAIHFTPTLEEPIHVCRTDVARYRCCFSSVDGQRFVYLAGGVHMCEREDMFVRGHSRRPVNAQQLDREEFGKPKCKDIYWNADRDIISLSGPKSSYHPDWIDSRVHWVGKIYFGGIKKMAVDCLLFEHWEPKRGFMEHLEKLYVVVPEDEPDVDWEGAKEVFTNAVSRGKEEGYEGASEKFALVRVQNLEEFGEAIKFTPSLVKGH